MTLPWAFEASPYRCRADGKRMSLQMGQHEDTGQLEQVHVCAHCGWSFQGEALPYPIAKPLWTTLEQMMEFRTRHLDRPEVRAGLGLDA